MISTTTVHVTGINWQLWAALAGPILTILGGIGHSLNRKLLSVEARLDNQDKAKFEFEKTVNEQHRDLGERVSRLEGPIQATAEAVKG